MTTKVSFWLIPSEKDRVLFQEIIDTLAQEYDAPTFIPHVTIYSGDYAPEDSPTFLFERAIQDVQGLSLRVDNVLYTDEFTKSLFVQFQPSSQLSQISETIRNSSQTPSIFTLNPHLSLIYKYLSEEVKENIITKLNVPKTEVLFDEVIAISASAKVQNREDVESWRVIYTKKLQRS